MVNISNSFSVKYKQKLVDHPEQLVTDALKTSSKRFIQKTADTTGDLMGNKMLIES